MEKELSFKVEIGDFFTRIKQLDLGPIAYKLMHPETGSGWTRDRVSRALTRYLMFLCLLYLYPHLAIAPNREIDRVWHQHILDTSKYAEDCQMLFGRFIHHFPYFGIRDEGDRQQLDLAFQQTQSLFDRHFGVILAEASTDTDDESNEESKSDSQDPGVCVLLEQTQTNRPTVNIAIDLPNSIAHLG
ncbi:MULTISPECIES: hypothetical protein [Oxynema]|nr:MULTISPECIES: hypothetical protein [Oxynema]